MVKGAVVYADISAGGLYSCGASSGGELWCWGYNENGQLGAAAPELCSYEDEFGNLSSYPCSLYPIRSAEGLLFSQTETNTQHTCGLTNDARLYCWGFGERGQLGNGEMGRAYFSVTPVLVSRQP